MQKTLSRIAVALLALTLLFLLSYLIAGQLLLEPEAPSKIPESYELADHWILEYADKRQIISIPYQLEDAELGLTYSIETILQDYAEGCDTLLLWNKGQDLVVSLNGEQVYSYDEKNISSWGYDRPFLWLFISVPPLHAGDSLVLTFQSANENSLGAIGDLRIGTDSSLRDYVIKTNQIEFVASVFLALFGIFCLLGGLLSRVFAKRPNAIGFLGTAIFVLSLWMIADSRLRQFIFPNASTIRQIAFLTVSLIPAPFALYLDEIQKHRYHYLYLTIEMLSYASFAITLVADLAKIQSLSNTFVYSAFLCFLLIILMVMSFVIDFIKGHIQSYKLVALGFLVMGISGAIEVVYYIISQTKALSATIMLGGLLFMALLSLIYALQGFETLHKEKSDALAQVKNLSLEMMETLVKTVDAKDHYTSGHSMRVARYAKEIATRMDFSLEEQDSVYYAGMLHDVGKIGISDEIINKPDRLTSEEYAIIKSHPVVGYEILSTISERPDMMNAARWHHERFDGKGYPDGLAGEEIPLIARIISVADAYDAMTSKRSYRPALTRRSVLKELEKGRGTQFDSSIVDVMIQMINDYSLAQEEARQEVARQEFARSKAKLLDQQTDSVHE